ncbi:hypothetical protein QVD17_38884 [Tagetes erecta]|uniref:TORTIFOLIA1/SINE1-2 N-terminal domain-containing protein n=1 Tax=Tagetes erecta TaxID=13708 RepID=A0AAD8JMK1_TARER|nr:hypothetical protein QVD17_38884 [Tagetes erecta]
MVTAISSSFSNILIIYIYLLPKPKNRAPPHRNFHLPHLRLCHHKPPSNTFNMSPTKQTTTITNHSPPQNLKHQILTLLHKLSDRDTHSTAATELESIAKSITNNSIPQFLSSITTTNSSDKSPVRKQHIRLISTLSESHGDVLSPHLSKLISVIIRNLRDHNTAVRTACVVSTTSIAIHITKPPFTSLIKPFVDALVTEQDLNAQIGAALCVSAVIDNAPDPDTVYLRRLILRVEKLLNSDCFKAKSALLMVVVSVISVGVGLSEVIVKSLVKVMLEFVVKSEDWCVRKNAAVVLEKLAIVETDLLLDLKVSCLKTFEVKRFDKVKCVRETMNRMIEAWNAIPDLSESHSFNEEYDVHHAPTTPNIINKRTLSRGSSTGNGTRTNLLETSSKKSGRAMFCKLERKKSNAQKRETKRVLFDEISDEKMHECQYDEDRSSSRVAEINDSLKMDPIQQDFEDLSLIRNQLVQIETQQSNLFDLLEKFIGSSLNGMQSLESRVRGVESTLDEISFDLAKSTGQASYPEPTLCCKLPGADLLSSKCWKKPEIQQSNMRNYSPPSVKNKDLESYNLTMGLQIRNGYNGLIKNPLAEAPSHQI